MLDDDKRPRPRRKLRTLVFLMIIAIIAAIAVACGRPTGDSTLDTEVGIYLKIKSDGYIKEVWTDGTTLRAELHDGFEHAGRLYKYLQIELPPHYLEDVAGWKTLSSGLDPARFHFNPPDVWWPIMAQFIPWALIAILIAAAVIAGVIILIALIGALLPKGHVATRRATFRQRPETVWQVITDVDAFPSWRPDLKKVERLDGGRWREIGRHGAMTLEIAEQDPPRRLVGRIADRSLPFGGTWTYALTPVEGGTELALTENGEVYNVLFRFLSRFVFGHAATLEQYLKALGRKFGEDVTIRD